MNDPTPEQKMYEEKARILERRITVLRRFLLQLQYELAEEQLRLSGQLSTDST